MYMKFTFQIIYLTYFHAFRLTQAGRDTLKKFGSKKIDDLKFRDSLLIVGQYGVKPGAAIEYVNIM